MNYKIVLYLLIITMASTSTLAVQKMPSLAELFLGQPSSIYNGGQSHLPNGLYSVGGVLKESESDIISINSSGEADLDFINTITHGKSGQRSNLFLQTQKISEVDGYRCSINPDFSSISITKPTTTKICYSNQENPGAVLRVFDMEDGMKFMGETAASKGNKACFTVESDHQYMYDVFYCTELSCNCNFFRNQYCQENNGKLQMMRIRDCSPDNCDNEEALVDWIDSNVEGCNKYKNYCRETDAGRDYIHYGKTTFKHETMADVCIDDKKLKEYYCADNEIQSSTHYCLETQKCIKGECVQNDIYDDCGIVDGKLRKDGNEWCNNVTRKTCNNGQIKMDYANPDCSQPACDYNGMIFNVGEKICMANAATIAECKNPQDSNSMFDYTVCPTGFECEPNSRETVCSPVGNETFKPIKIRRTVWEWLKEFIGGIND